MKKHFKVKKKQLSKKEALKGLGVIIAGELVIIAFVVFLFDPFYQYHAPYFGMDAVLYDRDNQVIGTVRNFSYDSVLLGSSVAENFNTSFLDEQYGCHTLKIIRASSSTADLLYYLDKAHEKQKLKKVFWCLDTFALTSSLEVTLYSGGTPRYLHTETFTDDFAYLFNKEILFVKIPQMIAYAQAGINTGGFAYDWSQDKEFSAAKAMMAYDKPAKADEIQEEQITKERLSLIEQNVKMVVEEINSHPETEYTIFFPPYSMLWWDCGYVNGTAQEYFSVLEKALPSLLTCENANIYFFQAERQIICNLDNYMDMIHYSPQINQYMLELMSEDFYRVTKDNVASVLQNMKDTYTYIIEEGIYTYYK